MHEELFLKEHVGMEDVGPVGFSIGTEKYFMLGFRHQSHSCQTVDFRNSRDILFESEKDLMNLNAFLDLRGTKFSSKVLFGSQIMYLSSAIGNDFFHITPVRKSVFPRYDKNTFYITS